MRKAEIKRTTSETDITCSLTVDGTGSIAIETGCGFLNHMLELFARHGRFDISLVCNGDTQVDYHHTTEDIGIVLGRAFSQALGNRAGILRYGTVTLPMDEALITAALDISGRGLLCYGLQIPTAKVGDFDTELVQEFFLAFTRELGLTLHLTQLAGQNSHHIIEGSFKAFARALAIATNIDAVAPDAIPSTKGTIL